MIFLSIYKTIKECDRERIAKGEEFEMTLEMWAEPEFFKEGCDCVLILDTSGSMIENGLSEMKKAACRYADILLSDRKRRIAVVSFDNVGRINLPLSDDIEKVKSVINSLEAKNYTNHADAFKKACEALKLSEKASKTAVIFTDGDSTIKGDIEAERKKLLALGTEIFAVALGSPMSIRLNTVKSWASEIKSEHFFHISHKCEIEKAFARIAENTGKSFEEDIRVEERLRPGFVITKIKEPSRGKVCRKDERTLIWNIKELGREHREGAKLNFTVRYTGCQKGKLNINESITYKDRAGSKVTFPDPSVFVCDEAETCTEPCGEPLEVSADPCAEIICVDGKNEVMQSLGRIVNVNVVLKDICPDKRVALGVILTEMICGKEETRGMKTLLIPAHHGEECRDIEVKCIKFAVPEELSPDGRGLCGKRDFKVRTVINYVDAEFTCCQ